MVALHGVVVHGARTQAFELCDNRLGIGAGLKRHNHFQRDVAPGQDACPVAAKRIAAVVEPVDPPHSRLGQGVQQLSHLAKLSP